MAPKRSGQDEGHEYVGPADDTVAAAQALRAAADAGAPPGRKSDEEKMSLFWRVFGGTILSIGALVAITLYNNLTVSISEVRAELSRANEARAAAVAELKAEAVRKDEFNTRLATSYDRLQGLQQQNNTQNALLTSLRTELDGLKDRAGRQATAVDGVQKDVTAALDGVKKEVAAAVDGVRKDQAGTTDALKKDVAALEAVKDRLVALAGDLKGVREDHQKLRADVDRNQAYDFERRDRRDAQIKQVDEVLKELHKGTQELRERVARLEGQAAPAAPVPPGGPKKAVSSRPAKPAADPKEPADGGR